jgi:hypothetical protein
MEMDERVSIDFWWAETYTIFRVLIYAGFPVYSEKLYNGPVLGLCF